MIMGKLQLERAYRGGGDTVPVTLDEDDLIFLQEVFDNEALRLPYVDSGITEWQDAILKALDEYAAQRESDADVPGLSITMNLDTWRPGLEVRKPRPDHEPL